MRRAVPLLIALAACSSAGTAPHTADVSGLWRFTESFSDVTDGISCADTGTYFLVQQGAMFSGVYSQHGRCVTPQGAVSNADSGSVSAGQMTGHTLRFAAPNCAYDGSLDPDTQQRIDGHVACQLSDATRTLKFTGFWKASR
jgi:hypothetical protein